MQYDLSKFLQRDFCDLPFVVHLHTRLFVQAYEQYEVKLFALGNS